MITREGMGTSSGNSEENNDSSSYVGNNRKERLRWTDELNDRFEETINQLGGADRATPKGILKTMDIPGLTIYHVKSHLQKYRIAMFIPETSSSKSCLSCHNLPGGKYGKRSISDMLANFSATSAVQLNEALRLYLEAERQVSHQIEASLKQKIKARGRYMDRIDEDLHTRKTVSFKQVKSFNNVTCLPSLRNESEANSPGQNQLHQSRALKRFRVENDIVSVPLENYATQYLAKPNDCQNVELMLDDQGMGKIQYRSCTHCITKPWKHTVLGPLGCISCSVKWT